MQVQKLLEMIKDVLEEHKGADLTVLDVEGKTSVTDFMVLVTSTSERHGKSLANYVVEKVKEHGLLPLGVEGQQGSDWVLVDLGDIILHIMTGAAREYYDLEKLWTVNHVEEIDADNVLA